MAIASEVVPWLARKGVSALATSRSTLLIGDQTIDLPINHRRHRPSDLANWIVKKLNEAPKPPPATPPEPAPEPEPEVKPPAPSETESEEEELTEEYVNSLKHKELDVLVERMGLPVVGGENKADKQARIIEVMNS